MIHLNRPWEDRLPPPSAMQTFALRRPPGQEFWRKATCEEINCEHWRNGWETRIDVSTELGQEQAAYIIKRSGRSFSQERESEDILCFTFTPGQPCFAAADHKVAVEREPIYLHRIGDHRTPRGAAPVRRHVRGADWVENMQEELNKVAEDRKRG